MKPIFEKHRKIIGIVGAAVALVTFLVKDELSSVYVEQMTAIDHSLDRFDSDGLLIDVELKLDRTSNIAERILDKDRHLLRNLQIEEEQANWRSYHNTLTLVSELLHTLHLENGRESDLLQRLNAQEAQYGDNIDHALKERVAPEEAEFAPPSMLTYQGMAIESHLVGLVAAVKDAALAKRTAINRQLSITRWTGSALFVLGWTMGLLGQFTERAAALPTNTRRWHRATTPTSSRGSRPSRVSGN
jgi:hypothetical protein